MGGSFGAPTVRVDRRSQRLQSLVGSEDPGLLEEERSRVMRTQPIVNRCPQEPPRVLDSPPWYAPTLHFTLYRLLRHTKVVCNFFKG